MFGHIIAGTTNSVNVTKRPTCTNNVDSEFNFGSLVALDRMPVMVMASTIANYNVCI